MRAFAISVLLKKGVPRTKAIFAVDALLDKDLQGDHLRGLGELVEHVTTFDAGTVVANPRTRIVSKHGGVVVVEAPNGFFLSVGYDAVRLCIRLAREHGIAFVGVRSQLGRLEPYLDYATARGMVAFGTILSPPLLAAKPTAKARVGNNPLAIAARGATGRELIFDGALSMSSLKPVRARGARGKSLPAPFVYDARGIATTDASHLKEDAEGAAIEGSLVPIGAYKGYGLAAALGILSGLLVAPQSEVQGTSPPPLGTALICIDPKAVGTARSFANAVDGYLDWLCSTPGGTFPGERSRQAIREGRRANRVWLSSSTKRALRKLSRQLSMACPV